MIISIAHSKGGCGKSLLTLNLAPLINNLVLIDLDTQNSITEINKARKTKHSINHALSETEFFNILDSNEDKNIIIDCGGIDSDVNRLAVVNSDVLIIPVKDNSFEILAFVRYIKVIEKLIVKNPNLKIMALINNVHHSSKDFSRLNELIDSKPYIYLAKTIIRQRAVYSNLLEEGLTVVEKMPNSNAATDIESLNYEIKGLYYEKKN